MSKEIWKAIKGYDGMYEVSNLGRVRSWHESTRVPEVPRILSQGYTRGYMVVNLPRLDRAGRYTPLVHRLVAETFIGPAPAITRPTVNHKNRAKADNRVENLEWMSHADNNRHGSVRGREKLGDASRRADGTLLPVLSAKDVARIRELRATQTYAQLAERFGVTKNYIWMLVSGRARGVN